MDDLAAMTTSYCPNHADETVKARQLYRALTCHPPDSSIIVYTYLKITEDPSDRRRTRIEEGIIRSSTLRGRQGLYGRVIPAGGSGPGRRGR